MGVDLRDQNAHALSLLHFAKQAREKSLYRDIENPRSTDSGEWW